MKNFVEAVVPALTMDFPLFHTDWYRFQINSSFAEEATFAHYLVFGWRDGVSPHPLFNVVYYRANCQISRDDEPLSHYVRSSGLKYSPHPLIDFNYYISQAEDLAGSDPLTHYLETGWRRGWNIGRWFDCRWYLDTYADARTADCDPLTHWLVYGCRDGRKPTQTDDAADFAARVDALVEQSANQLRSKGLRAEPGIRPPPLETERLPALASFYDSVALVEAISAASAAAWPPPALGAAKLAASTSDSSLKDAPFGLATGPGTESDKSKSLAALGLRPLKRPSSAQINYTMPILARYNETRLTVSNRLRLDVSHASSVSDGPLISVILPVYKTPIVFLERAILSVFCQTYANWELIIVDDFSQSENLATILDAYAKLDRRIKVFYAAENGGISAASNIALRHCRGHYVALLDHDDMITCDALEHFANAIAADPSLDLIYSDEVKIDEHDVVDDLFPKPDWSEQLLYSVMYTAHLSAYRTDLLLEIGGFRSQFDFSQDYDVALRVSRLKPRVHHIEAYLYGWRMISGSAAAGGKPTARISNIAALQDAGQVRGWQGQAIALPTANRFKRASREAEPLVSIIVPSDNLSNIKSTIDSIQTKTKYQNYEILVVTNSDIVDKLRSVRLHCVVRFVNYDKQYNFSDKCNEGSSYASGDHLIFFNDDVRVISPDWIETCLEYLERDGVGIVGPKLLYEDGSIQHGGMVTGVRRLVGTAFHTFPADTSAHFNFGQSSREVSLICGACLAMPKAVFFEVGQFDAVNAPISHSDVDLCFKVREAGYSCVYVPFAELTHVGHMSIGDAKKKIDKKNYKKDRSDIFLMERWSEFTSRDPYFTKPMRDIVYIDSQEPFSYHPPKGWQRRSAANVLIFSHDLSRSGAPRIVLDMARNFTSVGAFVTVLSPEDGPIRDELLAVGAHVIIDELAISGNQNILDFGRNFDLVIANTAVCWRVLPQLVTYCPVYAYIHETELLQHLSNLHPDFAGSLRSATAVWAGSEHSARYLRSFGIEPVILPYGVERPGSSSGRTRKAKHVVISALATFEPRKGQDLAILGFQALPRNVRSRSKLRLAGRVNDIGFFDAIGRFAAADDRIEFHGELDFERYTELLHASDIIICASRDDTLPLVSLNALAAGKILICSRETGTSAYIEDGVSGYVLAHNDPETIAETLVKAIKALESGQDIGANARSVFERSFSIERFREALAVRIAAHVPLLAGELTEGQESSSEKSQ